MKISKIKKEISLWLVKGPHKRRNVDLEIERVRTESLTEGLINISDKFLDVNLLNNCRCTNEGV